ncbi:Hsp33 family molecular chaperone HslO [Spiroplasma endosymbiont of Aspidapion aeneum]|uniref:Hsp33 family molecular chaperone HslO n=1 Tax=Spiroplasma endosymbiont of Aspidapion aeneum TaxID=3066276 RepID=UPI00313D881F
MDRKYRAISDKYNVKISFVDITESLSEICRLQKTNVYATKQLSKVVIDTCLLGLNLKDKDTKIATSYKGDGLMGHVIGEYNDDFIRGYCQNPDFKIEQFDLKSELDKDSQAIGVSGILQVTRKRKKQSPFTSNVEIISNSIDVNFMYTMSKSDQIKTFLCSNVDINSNNIIASARGIAIQILPLIAEETIEELEDKFGSIEKLQKKISSGDVKEIIKLLIEDAKILEIGGIRFSCSCSKENAKNAIFLLGEDQIEDIKNKNEDLEILCDFCMKKYIVTVKEIIDEKSS